MLEDLWFEDCVEIGTDVWFAAGNYNGLYKFDTKNNQVKRMAFFPGEPIMKDWAFRRVRLWKEQLVFMPAYADAVYLYDIKKGMFDRIEILSEKELLESSGQCRFQCFEIYKDWLYLVGYQYRGIIKVNLENHQVKKMNNIPEEVLGVNIEMRNVSFGTEALVQNDIIYIACTSSNRILMLDMNDDSFKVAEVGNSNNRYNGICKIEDAYYLTVCDNDNIVKWEYENGNSLEIELKFDTHFYDRKICQTENYIWVFSYMSNEIYRIEKGNYHIVKMQANYPDNRMLLVFAKGMQDGIYFVNNFDSEWHFLREDGTDENLHFIIKEPDIANVREQFLTENRFKAWGKISENSIATIEALLLKTREESMPQIREPRSNYGEIIYAAIKGEK